MSAEVAGEAILLLGGLRALLLQIAHPLVARGVAEHSGFAADPLRRLHGTLRYLYALALGSPDQAARVIEQVRTVHRSVRSAEGSEPAYSAQDAQLQLWVAATLHDTGAHLHELAFGPLPAAVAEQVYLRGARVGTALGMPNELWPSSRADFAEYWARQLVALRPDPVSRRLARQLLGGVGLPGPVRPLLPSVRLFTVGMLPPEARAALGLRWDEASQRRFEIRLTRLIRLYRVLPRRLRRWPATRYLRRL